MEIKNNFRTLYLAHQSSEDEILKKSTIAKALGMSRSTLDNWLQGEVTRYDGPVLKRICDFFNVALSQLLEYTPPGHRAVKSSEIPGEYRTS